MFDMKFDWRPYMATGIDMIDTSTSRYSVSAATLSSFCSATVSMSLRKSCSAYSAISAISLDIIFMLKKHLWMNVIILISSIIKKCIAI